MNLSKKSMDMLKSKGFIDEGDIETTNINVEILFKNCQYIQNAINGEVEDFDYYNPTDEILNLLDKIQDFLQCLEFETTENQELNDTEEIVLINGEKFNIAEMETIYNKYMQGNAKNIDDYFNKQEEYTLKDFIENVKKNDIELCVYKDKVDLIKDYFVNDMTERDLAQFIYNLSIGIAELENLDNDPDIVVLNKDTGKEKFVWIKEY